ncbi:TIGR03749 family integrating conjugative element protein [Pseudomonas caricapapayae]|uniref:TIGR03749 family integrating conjugative element protein n=1 Tax=Pseudomonas caricapapayae TaxID=46678 RepID=UPI000EFDD83F|nr:TIGR03749 family integrating conjugative element protein [Pseudomonas caricapapayae]
MKRVLPVCSCVVAAAAGLILSIPAHAVEILRWERLPLPVPLVVGQERVVFVEENVRVGVPNSIKDKLRVQSANGAIYLKASDVIEPTRLQVKSATTGELILLDIAATSPIEGKAELEPVKVVRGDVPSTKYGSAPVSVQNDASDEEDEDEPDARPEQRSTPVPVVLTRYASQSLYAPLRTVEAVDGISQVNINPTLDLSALMPTQPVQATVLAAWKLDDYWVTAVRLKNLSAMRIVLDPRELNGDLRAATFQHPYLGNRGSDTDTTVAYLITQGRDLSKSVLPSMSPIDPSANLGGAKHEH